MKYYTVEFKRVSYITLQIEAESESLAEDAAWLQLQTSDYDEDGADWVIEYIEEQQAAA